MRLGFRNAFNFVVRNVLGTITHISTREPIAALTFDDGPHPEFTPRLLEILEKHKALATFFMLGKNARRYPELVKRVAQAGHVIGNHSWDHPSFPLITSRQRRSQMRACAKSIAPYGQKLFRSPYGHLSLISRFDTLLLGYQPIAWNLSARDWLNHDAKWMVNRIVDQIQPGSIILFHDALNDFLEQRYADRLPTLQAVNLILEQLDNDYRFVTIPELFMHGHPQRSLKVSQVNIDLLNALKSKNRDCTYY